MYKNFVYTFSTLNVIAALRTVLYSVSPLTLPGLVRLHCEGAYIGRQDGNPDNQRHSPPRDEATDHRRGSTSR